MEAELEPLLHVQCTGCAYLGVLPRDRVPERHEGCPGGGTLVDLRPSGSRPRSHDLVDLVDFLDGVSEGLATWFPRREVTACAVAERLGLQMVRRQSSNSFVFGLEVTGEALEDTADDVGRLVEHLRGELYRPALPHLVRQEIEKRYGDVRVGPKETRTESGVAYLTVVTGRVKPEGADIQSWFSSPLQAAASFVNGWGDVFADGDTKRLVWRKAPVLIEDPDHRVPDIERFTFLARATVEDITEGGRQ